MSEVDNNAVRSLVPPRQAEMALEEELPEEFLDDRKCPDDAIFLKEWSEVDDKYVVRVRYDFTGANTLQCYHVADLYQWLQNANKDPLLNKPYTQKQLDLVWQRYRRTLDPNAKRLEVNQRRQADTSQDEAMARRMMNEESVALVEQLSRQPVARPSVRQTDFDALLAASLAEDNTRPSSPPAFDFDAFVQSTAQSPAAASSSSQPIAPLVPSRRRPRADEPVSRSVRQRIGEAPSTAEEERAILERVMRLSQRPEAEFRRDFAQVDNESSERRQVAEATLRSAMEAKGCHLDPERPCHPLRRNQANAYKMWELRMLARGCGVSLTKLENGIRRRKTYEDLCNDIASASTG